MSLPRVSVASFRPTPGNTVPNIGIATVKMSGILVPGFAVHREEVVSVFRVGADDVHMTYEMRERVRETILAYIRKHHPEIRLEKGDWPRSFNPRVVA